MTEDRFTLADIRAAKTSHLIGMLNPETLAATLLEAGVEDLTKEQMVAIVQIVIDEIDRRIPVGAPWRGP